MRQSIITQINKEEYRSDQVAENSRKYQSIYYFKFLYNQNNIKSIASMSALHPTIKWAQRKDRIYITLEVRDIENEKVELKEDNIKFQCSANKNKYQFVVNFLQPVVVEGSKWSKTGFHMIFVLVKKEKKYWSRLTKESKKTQYIQIDWDKWVDEDEEEEAGNKGLGGLDQEGMRNFNDSDDEQEQKKQANLDDLEKEQEIEKA